MSTMTHQGGLYAPECVCTSSVGWMCGRDLHLCTSIVLHIKRKMKPAHALIQEREHGSLGQKQTIHTH